MRLLLGIFIVLLLTVHPWAQVEGEAYVYPLPKQSAYVDRGFSVGIGVGVFQPTEDCDCIGLWQGLGDFHYTDWLSAGVDVRFFGGDLDADAMVLYQRYRVFSRFHLPFSTFGFYAAPFLGFVTTDISQFRKEIDQGRMDEGGETLTADSLDSEGICEKMFSLDGFSSGIEVGFGWGFSKYLGATGAFQYEYNFSHTQQLTLTPGLAFNLKNAWNWANSNVKSMWVSLEGSFQRYFNRGVSKWASSITLGFQLGV